MNSTGTSLLFKISILYLHIKFYFIIILHAAAECNKSAGFDGFMFFCSCTVFRQIPIFDYFISFQDYV